MERNRTQRQFGGLKRMDAQQRKVVWRLARYVLHHYRFSILLVLLCIVVSSVTTLASTLFTRSLIDDYIIPLTQKVCPDYSPLADALIKLGLLLAFGVVCSYTYNRLMINVSQGTLLRLRKQLFESMERLPVSYFDQRSHGEIMSVYTNDVDALRQMISSSLAQVFNSIITIIVTFSSMIVLSVPLTIVSVFMAAVMMTATTLLGKRSRKFFKVQQSSLAEMNGFIEEMMTGQKVVKVFCHEEESISRFEEINERLRYNTCEANRIANIVMPVNGNLSNLGYVLIAVIGASIAISDYSALGSQLPFSLSLGTIVAFLTLNKSFTQPITQVSQQINSVMNASVGAERIFQLMDEKPEVDEGSVQLENPQGDVDFNHVDFSYSPDKQVLYNININTAPGQRIAFVGGTGAGKTTVINLINRFYEIQSGSILFDGIPITDINKRSLRKSMSIVLQETHLFTGSVMDNIRYGRLEATDEECVKAAKLIGADDFIRRLANGYATQLSADGSNLSQGERQLLAITRAAVANPPVLILDEATSSIDTRTERLVQQGMETLMNGRTTFIIAHRLSTVRNADMIIVLEQGHIIEQGTHDELLGMRGKYYQLYRSNEIA